MTKVDVVSEIEKKLSSTNPFDWFNESMKWDYVTTQIKELQSMGTAEFTTGISIEFVIQDDMFHCIDKNALNIIPKTSMSKFGLFCLTKFKNNWSACATFVSHVLMKQGQPFVRVGTDYYKQVTKTDSWGNEYTQLNPWKKETIKDDLGQPFLKSIPKYDDFINEPNNINFERIVNNQYNIYNEFRWTPKAGDMKWSKILMKHVFGDQEELGWTYMKCLYTMPKQMLPVLVLMSPERGTGKTTFLNWINMIYGSNYIIVSPEDIFATFNSGYANKVVIAMEETFIDKQHGIEKIKKLATSKTLAVNQKFVNAYTVNFFGKLIMTTNKDIDFMRIDLEEIRFWTRKLKPLSSDNLNTNIEADLMKEIPALLHYLIHEVPDIDLTRSRMVFTPEEIATDELNEIKEESKSGLHKELYLLIQEWFDKHQGEQQFLATPGDIKLNWFDHNQKISVSYIRKVLKNEMGYENDGMQRYVPFESKGTSKMSVEKVRGRPYKFDRNDFDSPLSDDDESLPF